MTLPSGTLDYSYDVTTGQLNQITTSDSALSFSYDGFLPLNETWTGTITGTVSRSYDNNFWISALSVNGDTITYGYDNDGLLTQAGGLTLTRDPQNGLLTGTDLNGLTSTHSYNSFGEPVTDEMGTAVAVTATLQGQGITEAELLVSGQLSAASSVQINGQPLAVAADGSITDSIPLALGDNPLLIEVYGRDGQLGHQETLTVTRLSPSTGLSMEAVWAVAPGGDIYFRANGQAQRLAGGGSIPDQPSWLAGAEDVAVDTAGQVYLRKGPVLSVYDGLNESALIDLAAAGLSQVDDMEVSPGGQVYVVSGLSLYRIESGNLVLHATLPGNIETLLFPTQLDSSAWGLVALMGDGRTGLVQVQADGSTVPLWPLRGGTAFAVNDGGTFCYADLGSVKQPDGAAYQRRFPGIRPGRSALSHCR